MEFAVAHDARIVYIVQRIIYIVHSAAVAVSKTESTCQACPGLLEESAMTCWQRAVEEGRVEGPVASTPWQGASQVPSTGAARSPSTRRAGRVQMVRNLLGGVGGLGAR